MSTPQIWVGCLAAYNAGRLHGEWIEADQEPDDIHAEIQRMLEESPVEDAEEWGIFDTECFGGWRIEQHEDIERVADIADMIVNSGLPAAVVTGFAARVGFYYATPELLRDQYVGCYEDLESFGQHRIDWDAIPSSMHAYIDVTAWANDQDVWEVRHDHHSYIFTVC